MSRALHTSRFDQIVVFSSQILSSFQQIFQVELFTIKTFHEVVDQIYYKVICYFLQGINTPLIDSRLTIWNLGQQAPEKLLAEVSDTAYPPEMMTPYMNNMNIEQHPNKS